jgi:tetratricopeptide (TPR) repeat protein
LKARALLADTDFGAAEESLLSAVELDPEFAEAYELLARAHWHFNEQQPTVTAAGKALAIDPDLVIAQALYQQAKIGSHLAGIEAFEQALRKQPDDPFLLLASNWNLFQAGYLGESLSASQRLVDLDPLSPIANNLLRISYYAVGRTSEALAAMEVSVQLRGRGASWMTGNLSLLDMQDEQAIALSEAFWQGRNHPDISWVRDLITRARDPATGQAYLDRRIPEIVAAFPEIEVIGLDELNEWYLYFGFLDRYFEILFENDPNDSRWTQADIYLERGIEFRRTGFTEHPQFLEVANTMGLIKIWDKRGPPDFCDKVGGQWVCE